jgi:steroid delta-isomerase-like uncharacterized protein
MRALATAISVFAFLACAQPAMSQTLGTLVQSGNEQLLNRGNLAIAADIFAPTYTSHDTTGEVRGGPELIQKFVTDLRAAFPDLHVEVQVLLEQGNRVVWLRTHRGTHRGAYMGVPASGRSIVWQEMVVTRYEAGKVAEEWSVSDLGERLRTP